MVVEHVSAQHEPGNSVRSSTHSVAKEDDKTWMQVLGFNAITPQPAFDPELLRLDTVSAITNKIFVNDVAPV
jgi:hypothetical protein